jgi:hypothetical protein
MVSEEKIMSNWKDFLSIIKKNISQPRKGQLLKFYESQDERISMLPASMKTSYHNAFPGGYVDHVIRVVNIGMDTFSLWKKYGANVNNFTKEELIFSALNHDLGKIGTLKEDAYLPQTDQWRKKNLGEEYMFNENLQFMEVPHRSIFLLQQLDISFSMNEMIAILTHDGLYNKGNENYLMGYNPSTKPRNSLPYILHQADMMASRIEFETEWMSKLNNNSNVQNTPPKNKVKPTSTLDPSFKNILDSL